MGRVVREMPRLYRSFPVELRKLERAEGDAADAPALYEMTVSSEEPALQWYWGEGVVEEVLSHAKGAIDTRYLDVGAAFLDNHSTARHVGTIRSWEIDEKARKLRVQVQFSRNPMGQEVERDFVDKIKTQVSIGYDPSEAVLVKKGDPAKGERNKYRVDHWVFYEASAVPIAADVTVGPGRAKPEEAFHQVTLDDGEAVERGGRAVDDEKKGTTAPAPAADPAIEVRGAEIDEILGIAQTNQISVEEIRGWFKKGMNSGQVSMEILKRLRTDGKAQPSAEAIGMSAKDRRNYSFARAMLLGARVREGGQFDGLEAEVHRELEKGFPSGAKRWGGILVPTRLGPMPKSYEEALDREREKRAMLAGTANAGKEMVFTEPGDFIDMLPARSVCMRMGATVLTDLNGPVSMPRQTSDPTMAWGNENPGADVAESSPGTDKVDLAPKSLRGRSHYTREFLAQSSVAAENYVRSRLARSAALTFDKAGLHGTGAPQPTGIYGQAGVLTRDCGPGAGADAVPDWADITQMAALVADANADYGSQGYVTSPLLAGTLLATPKVAGQAIFIWEGTFAEGRMAGYPAMASGQILKTLGGGAEHGLIFGNWNELVLATWGVLELIVDPFTLAAQGVIRVIACLLADVGLLHGPSFCKGTNAIP